MLLLILFVLSLNFFSDFRFDSETEKKYEPTKEIAARLLFMAVRWAKSLSSFSALPFRDQVMYGLGVLSYFSIK